MSKPQIERYFGRDCLISALKAVGQSRQVVARNGLGPHFESYFEIHLIMDGTVNWWVEDESYILPPGTVYITKPGELHGGYKNLVQPCSLTWLQVDGEALADASMAAELQALDLRRWIGAQQLIGYIQAILDECRRPRPDSPRLVSAYLHLFLSHLLRQTARTEETHAYPPRFEQLLHYIDSHLAEASAVTVKDLCEFANLSRSRIFQLFNQYVGQSPISYIMSSRIRIAKIKLQQSDLSITEVALEMGFSSSQHFATVFKRITGATPTEYRRQTTDLRQQTTEGRRLS